MTASTWTGRASATFMAWVAAMVAVVAVAGGIIMATTPDSQTGEPAPMWSIALYGVAMLFALGATISFSRLVVRIDGSGFTVAFGPLGWPVKRFAWREVTAVSAIEIHPMQWGGWGYRWRPGRSSGAIMRKGPGLKLDLADNRAFVVSVDNPEAGAAVAQQYLGHGPAGGATAATTPGDATSTPAQPAAVRSSSPRRRGVR